MSRVAEMRDLIEEMARSNDDRMSGIKARQAEVQSARHEARQRMVACHMAQMEAAAALREGLAKARADLQADVQSTMQETHTARVASASVQRAELRKSHADLSQRVHDMLEGTCQAREELSADQRASLGKRRAELAADTCRFLGETSAARAEMAKAQQATLEMGRAELSPDVAGFLSEAGTRRTTMAKDQREELHAGHMALHAEVSTELAGFRQDRMALAENLAEFGQVWRSFTETMQSRRGGHVTSSPLESQPSPEAAANTPVGAEPEITSAGPDGPATREPHGAPTDEAVFAYLADHPDGLRLVELEEHFGTQRIRLVPILTRLIQENKACKEEERKLYFAT